MKTHLEPDEFIAALEQPPDAAAAEHLASCATCRTELAHLRRTCDELTGADVPEPSPLFWDHFPARVRRATDEDVDRRTASWWGSGRLSWALGSAAAVVVLAGAVLWGPNATRSPESSPAIETSDATVQFGEVADLFADLPTDEALAFAPAATATWALVDDLTNEERAAFVRLVERELEAMP